MAIRWNLYVPSFSYPVTRPYPYKWFPWVVLIGGIFSLVLFSIINLAANGYELQVQYTADPNSTVSQAQWAERRPFSWFSKAETICQSQTLQINSDFFTDKLSFPYTLTGVWQNRTTAENTVNVTVIPSLRYTDNVLENCTVYEMMISLAPENYHWSNWGVEAKVRIMCSINNDDIPTWFNLTTTHINADVGHTEYERRLFLHVDNTTKASLWWGKLLLESSNEILRDAVANQSQHSTANNDTEILVNGRMEVHSNYYFEQPMSSPLFFYEATDMTCVTNYSGVISSQYPCAIYHNTLGDSFWDLWPTIYPQADQYAKVLYSTILADLGSSSSNNILTNASLLQEYTQNASALGSFRNNVPLYNGLKDSMGPLEITPSTIYAEYFCQVPQRKPIGPLLVAIFVADLVFLQAAYMLLTWTTTAWTERNIPKAKFCEGCLANMERGPYELGLAAPTDPALQESLPESPETWSRLTLMPVHERHISSESQQSLVHSPALSE